MPRILAIPQACWAAAPPKQTRAWVRTSNPRATEISLIAEAIVSLAIRIKPRATFSDDRSVPSLVLISSVSFLKVFRVFASFRG